jgi:predicted metalloprotease with PDZ domain
MTPTRYRIVPADPNAHMFEVTCTVDDPDPNGQVFQLPAWIPGSYLIREFARHFVTVRAESQRELVGVRKTSKDTWRVDPCIGPLSFVAEVYAYDLSVRAAYLDGVRGYFNGPSVFVWPVGLQDRPCQLELVAPSGASFAGWRVATSLPRDGARTFDFGTYHAANYDALIDHPVEIGHFDVVHFEAGGAHHDVAVTGRRRGDLERLSNDLRKICQAQIDLFDGVRGGRAPFDNYTFLVLALGGDTYGGLEHRTSTSLVVPRESLPQPGDIEVSDAYRSMLGVASHEYFHAWNVKRIKPAAFVPYDLARESYTEQLWIFEGFTSYYDDLMLLRAGVIDAASYLELLAQAVTRHLRTPARAVQSVASSSFDAWIKYYRQDENSPNAVVSYYVKGSLVALVLDLKLRRDSGSSLDDVMRAAWTRYGRTGTGVPEGGMEALAAEISGIDLCDFFDAYVHGTRELPLSELLSSFAIAFDVHAADGPSDKGGKAAAKDAKARATLGAIFAEGNEMRLKNVIIGGPASRAGLAAGDAVVAVDGIRATAEGLQRTLKSRRHGERVELHAFRRDELMQFELTLDPAPADTCWLSFAENASTDAVRRRDTWLQRGAPAQ